MILPVYVIHWNAPRWCSSSVRSLLASTGIELEVCVVDNGQTGTPLLTDLLPQGTSMISMPSNRGYTGAANIAIRDFWDRHQGAEYLLIGSHDLHVKPDCLSMLVEMANKNRRLGVVAPVLIGPGNPSSGESYGMSGSLPHPIVHGSQVVRRDWASGTCLMFRRNCLDDVGFFDERFGSYGEDVDICLRAGDAGWQVGVVSDAVAWGLGSASLPALSRMEANSVLLASKRYGVWGAARALGVLVMWTGRSAAGSIAPWRNSSARRESRTYLRRHVEAIRQVPWRAAIQEIVSAPGGVANKRMKKQPRGTS